MTIDHGRSASPSGHSQAEPEEVSALRASVPNADPWAPVLADLDFKPCASYDARADVLYVSLHNPPRLAISTGTELRGCYVRRTPDGKITGVTILDFGEQAASAIEARRAATAETGAVHESAIGAAETPDTGRGTSHG